MKSRIGDHYFQQEDIKTLKAGEKSIEQVAYKGQPLTCINADGLRAAMGYVGAKTLDDLHEKAQFIRISSAGFTQYVR